MQSTKRTINSGVKARFRGVVLVAIAFFCLGLLATVGVHAQQSSGINLQQLLQDSSNLPNSGQSGITDLNQNNQSPTTLQPDNSAPVQLPTSRLEQIMSARAGVTLRQFGYDQLGYGHTVSIPQAGAVQDDYVLGSGDELVISLRGQENSEYRVVINRDGQIVLPRLSPVLAAGRTLGDFRADLLNAVHRAYVSTQSFVSLSRIRQISVIVTGEVNNPGTRLVTGLSSPLDAILLSGGVKKTGSLRDVKLVHAGTRTTIDLYDLLTGHGHARSVLLADGDAIIVPPLGRTVAVAGWVRRQGIYELPPGQAALTARYLLSLAGGLEVRGKYNMSVSRLLPNGSTSLVSLPAENALVRDSEILFVRPNADQSVSQATLAGGTPLAGQYAVGTATKLSALIRAPGALGTSPYTLFGLIVRRDPITQLRSLVPFAPVAVLSGRDDFEIRSDDVVRVFTTKEEALLSAVVVEFQKRIDLVKNNQDQLDLSQLDDQGQTSSSGSSTTPSLANKATGGSSSVSTGAITAPSSPPSLSQPYPGESDREILAALVAQTVDEGGNLSDRPATNEISPFGLTQAQTAYLASQPQLSQNAGQQFFSGAGNSPQSAQLTNGFQPSSVAQYPGFQQSQIQGSQQQNSSTIQGGQPELPTAPNMEIQQLAVGQVPTNTEVQTFGQLSRQLGIDPLVLVQFLIDHDATIYGSIHGAGLYFVGPGATVDDMIQAAGGLSNWTDKSSFEVVTTTVSSATGAAHTEHQLLAATDQTLTSYVIKPHDEIRFNTTFTNVGIGTVTIQGQVRNAGTYHIERGERLSELLLRAGGLTDQAYPYGTVFMRKSAAAKERDGYRRLASDMEDSVAEGLTRSGNQHLDPGTFSAIQSFVSELRNTPAIGRIAAITDPAVLAADPSRDTMLEPGDVIFIPQRPSTVAVLGQVMQPGNMMYNPKFTAADYIAKAGGYGRFADDGRTFLVLPDGTAQQVETSWLDLNGQRIPPGSTLVVPRDITPFDLRQLLLDSVSVLSSLAVSAASLAVISRNN